MNIVLIWAQAHNRAIGRGGAIPWHAPLDLKFFQGATKGQAVVMGRKTWLSLPLRPLPGRLNIVVSSGPALESGATWSRNLPQALEVARNAGASTAFVIGGQVLYEEAIHLADKLHVTQVDLAVEHADAFAPTIDLQTFERVGAEPAQDGSLRLVFETYRRR